MILDVFNSRFSSFILVSVLVVSIGVLSGSSYLFYHLNGDGCSSTWTIEDKFSCTGGSATTKDTCKPIWGDGLKLGSKQWDDGNKVSGDGCSSSWMTELYYICSGGSSTTKDTCSIYCGDGRRAGSKRCDDGNTVSGDGCSSSCLIESHYTCTGE